jgi:hypothetical protein
MGERSLAGRTAPASPACANCAAPVTGRFCAFCGQRQMSPVRSLWHFVQEAAEDLTHADSRIWQTLGALLFRPGELTREFLIGRRVRYLPPLRLYLVVSLLFFAVASVAPRIAAGPAPLIVSAAGSTAQRDEHTCSGIQYSGPWQARITQALEQACRSYEADNGRSLRAQFMHVVPRAMFLFLPVLALVMMLMYWRPRHYYIEHLLLLLHNHAFIFLCITLYWLAVRWLPWHWLTTLLTWVLVLYIPFYVYRSLRHVYGQGRWLTLAKLVVMSWAYAISAGVMLVLSAVYSILEL